MSLIQANALHLPLRDESVQCVVTSPPYWGLRDYGTATWEGGDAECEHTVSNPDADGKAVFSERVHRGDRAHCRSCGATRIDAQLGLEPTPEEYVANMVGVFREVRRVLKDDGIMWMNLGDSYYGSWGNSGNRPELDGKTQNQRPKEVAYLPRGGWDERRERPASSYKHNSLKPKDLVGIPWSVAKALQAPYYSGSIAKEVDRVWLAAIIDGEGSICGFTHERKDDHTSRTGIHVTITNTNIDLLDNAFRIWPTSKQEHNMHGEGHFGSADTYRWIAHNVDNKSNLLRELYPYFIAKKKQALLAWNFLEMSKEAKRLARTVEAEEVKDRRAWIVDAISKLNHFQSIDIPSWCKEPPSLYEPGWYLRSDIIWSKPNPMPESVTDRPTKAHEYLFLMTKRANYYYDAEAIAEPVAQSTVERLSQPNLENQAGSDRVPGKTNGPMKAVGDFATRNKRSVFTTPTLFCKMRDDLPMEIKQKLVAELLRRGII